MSDYLTRPVFPFRINWSETVAQPFSCDLHEVQLGFASPRFQRLQPTTARGAEFAIWLDSEAEVEAFDDFVDGLLGRCHGFWLPSPFTAIRSLSVVDSTHIKFARMDWPGYCVEEASQHVVFSKAGEDDQMVLVSSIASTVDGFEQMTLAEAVSVDESWDCRQLLYVRFASDDFQIDHLADNRAKVTLRTIELTQDYAAIEAGTQPVFLYEFWIDTTPQVTWRFTSLNQNVTSSLDLFTSAPIEHDGHSESLRHGESSLKLRAFYEVGNPLVRMFPANLPRSLCVRIYETTFVSPSVRTVIFTGRVTSMKLAGQEITAECSTLVEAVGRSFPRFLIQPRCNYALFSTCCGLSKLTFKLAGHIAELGVYRVAVSDIVLPEGWSKDLTPAPGAANWLALGWLETGSGATLEVRTIEASTAVVGGYCELTMNAPLRLAQANQVITMYAGCDGSASVCKAKFNNFENWGGHVMAPSNLSVTAMDGEVAQGVNKK
jgi:hypothetical protein